MKQFTDEEIIKIYNEDYIGKHMGGPALFKKYSYNFYNDFYRLKLKIRNNQTKNLKYQCDPKYFNCIDTEEKAYWLGFLFADGYIQRANSKNGERRVGITLQDDDCEHLEKYNKAIKSNAPIHHYKVGQGYKIGSPYCRTIITSDQLVNDLISHGCLENKTNILNPPIGVPEDLERHFIRGFMDGNGSISISKTKYGPSFKIRFTSTDEMLRWIMGHLIKNKIINREYPLYKRKPEQIVSSFEFGGNVLSKKYLDYIYDEATVWLDRKYDRYLKLSKILEERQNGVNHE